LKSRPRYAPRFACSRSARPWRYDRGEWGSRGEWDRPLAGFYLIGGYELDGRRVHVLADAGQTKTRVVLADEA
jgi:hypothetical protein